MKPPTEEEEVHHRHAAHGSGFKGGTRRDRVVISTVVIGVGLFLFVGMPYLKHNMPAEDVVLNSINNGDAPATRDADREAVRSWLRATSTIPTCGRSAGGPPTN